jgi:hypothetical protein
MCGRWPALNTGDYCRDCRPAATRLEQIKSAAKKQRAKRRQLAKQEAAAAAQRAAAMTLNIEERAIDL